jgi:pyruvate/2-oxoglutarate dehydrogenase complex dihydrolipoamide acyltransferase (E2) component
MNITSPCTGRVGKLTAKLTESYPVGATLGYLEATAEEAAKLGLDTPPPAAHGAEDTPRQTTQEEAPRRGVQPTVRGLPVPANAVGASYMSPRMKARLNDLGLRAADLAGIAGSGAAGRVTVQDLELFITQLEQQKLTQASTMRVAVADAMRRSWTRPIAMVALSFRLDALLAHRKGLPQKPGPALYAMRALGLALAENSAPGGRLIGNKIVHPSAIDIAFAVEAEDGVLVPVLRNVDRRLLVDLIQPYADLVELARQRKLPKDATGGSIATVTNYGTFGLELATPIPLPEQTLVLGLSAGRKVPHWDDAKEQFVPVMQANLTLSFDHRVLDGGAAGRLLTRVKDLLEQPGQL